MDCHHGLPYHYGYDANYLEDPDYIANDTRHQVPLLSSIGRGPRGAGIKVKVVKGANGSYQLSFVDDITNETLATSPNMDPGYFEITSTKHESVDGETRMMNIAWIHGSETKSWDIPIPAGAHGSRLYLSAEEFTYNTSLTYQTTVDDLIHYGRNIWQDKPVPRVNDIVCFVYKGGKEYRSLAFGTIEAVEKGQVVFTSRTTINIPIPTIGEDGHWYVDGKDTGVTAQGPKGDKGDTGPKGLDGKQGPKGDRGYKGAKGNPGKDGKDCKIEIGTVTTLQPTMDASVSATHDDKTNVTTLNFGIPEGAAGKAINIRGGIWKAEFLPPYDDTPINDAFIVYDGDKQFDLYVRGAQPYQAEDGGPWTVIENWQGRPGSSLRYLNDPYLLDETVGNKIIISTSEASTAFAYYDYLADDDLVLDRKGRIGIISSSEDNSGFYEITTVDRFQFSWHDIVDKPFSGVLEKDGLAIDDDCLYIKSEELNPEWKNVQNKPSTFPSKWNDVSGKPDLFPTSWELIANIPELDPKIIKEFPEGDWTTLDDGIYICTGFRDIFYEDVKYQNNAIVSSYYVRGIEESWPVKKYSYAVDDKNIAIICTHPLFGKVIYVIGIAIYGEKINESNPFLFTAIGIYPKEYETEPQWMINGRQENDLSAEDILEKISPMLQENFVTKQELEDNYVRKDEINNYVTNEDLANYIQSDELDKYVRKDEMEAVGAEDIILMIEEAKNNG